MNDGRKVGKETIDHVGALQRVIPDICGIGGNQDFSTREKFINVSRLFLLVGDVSLSNVPVTPTRLENSGNLNAVQEMDTL